MPACAPLSSTVRRLAWHFGKVVLRAVGYTLVGLAILAFVLYLVSKVMAGQSTETYYSGTMIRWSYGAALAMFVASCVLPLWPVSFALYRGSELDVS
jgi:hypothetical protein